MPDAHDIAHASLTAGPEAASRVRRLAARITVIRPATAPPEARRKRLADAVRKVLANAQGHTGAAPSRSGD